MSECTNFKFLMSSRQNGSFTPSKTNQPDASMYDPDDQGLGRRFLEKLNQHKDKIHQVDALTGSTETNGSVRIRSIKVAMEMHERGIRENDIILICSRTHSDQTVVVLATLLLGAIVAPLDPQSPQVEFKTCVLLLKPKMAFCDLRVHGQLEVIVRESSEMPHCQLVLFGDRTDRVGFEKFLKQKPDLTFKAVSIKDPRRRVAFIISSQSTSGPSKLVCISHYSIRLQIGNCAGKILQSAEKILSFFPLAWITQAAILCYSFEFPVIRIIPGPFSERSACRLIHDLKIDCAILGTDYALRMVRHASFQDYDLSCLKAIYVGGVLTPALDMTFLRHSFPSVQVLQCYGTTEMCCLISGFSSDDYQIALQKPGSVGKPLPGLKIKIVDFESREHLSADWWGELMVTGPTMMLGYYKDIVGTNAALEKGYFRTGDIAQYDTDGYLYIQGRHSNHILQNGARFFPSALEELILAHPHVFEAVVIGDERELIACVVKNPQTALDAEQLMEYISERTMESKRPTKIKFMDSLPKTTVGKVKRHALRHSILGVTIEHSKSVGNFEGKD